MKHYLWSALCAAVVTFASTAGAQHQAAPASVETSGITTPTSPTTGSREAGTIEYDLRMEELQGGLDELREDVFRSRSRLFLLREQILQDTLGGAQTVITHVNELGKGFRVISAVYSLDGNQIYAAHADGSDIENQRRVELLRSSVLPGAHNLSVQIVVEGRPRGLFFYPKSYRFTLTTSHAFSVDSGQTIELEAIGFKNGGASTYAERPQIRFTERRILSRDAAQATDAEE